MKRRVPGWALVWAGFLCSALLPVRADEAEQAQLYSDMAQGLRERQYYDYALLYLDQLAAKTDLPPEIRQTIPYEKAMVLLDSSKTQRLPEKQIEQLDQAQAFLEQFAKESPNHPKAGDANSQRADILLGKARVEILQSRNPTNQGIRSGFQSKARNYIQQAREVFATAQQQHEANYKSFGTFVSQDDKEKYEAREQALMQLIAAMLNVCQCRYEEAQTYDAGSPDNKKILDQAAEEFEQLHQRYRNYTGGLYARLYEAKCYDDQGSTQRAMGIYNELLEHDGTNSNLRKLQHKTLQFKLEALNRKTPPDSQVVVDLANEWIKNNKSDSRSQVGLAIQWEQALAYEALGDQRDLPKPDKERHWRTARGLAQTINKFRSPYSDVSLSMAQRLNGKLGGKDAKPESFEVAEGIAKQHFKAAQELRDELKPEKLQGKTPEDIKKLQQDLQTEMNDAVEMFQLALNLADKNDDPKQVATARLYLAYVHFWARRNYEAAILAEFVSRTAPKDESNLAIDAAYLAMAGYVQAFNDSLKGPAELRAADLGFVIKACESIIARWPDSERANDARLMAGRMYMLNKKPLEAAAWFSKVPEVDQRFAEAQMATGQAYWDAYRMGARMPAEERPPLEQLQQYQTTAQQHLRTGINKLAATLPTEGAPPPELADAKLSLAAMLINQGQDAEAIKTLLDDPQSVVKAVRVDDEANRPEQGVQKRAFAIEVYKLLLRAYVGASQLDNARAAMATLEAIAAKGTAGADVTELYVDLGKKLKTELDEYRAAGQADRFAALRTSFETFLNDVYQRKEGQTIGTLSWIGETYSALGEADAANQASAQAYYEKASSALQEILRLTEANPNFATTDQLSAVKTRLVHALRMKKDFTEGERLAAELLKQKKDDLNLQIETARLYQDWGGEANEEIKYKMAIGGNGEILSLGYGPLSKRLHSLIRRSKQPELVDTYLDMRYQTSVCRYRLALLQKSSKARREMLDNTEVEVLNFARATKDVPDEMRAQFNTLFHDIRAELKDPKRPVKDLEWTADLQMQMEPKQEKTAETEVNDKLSPAEKKPAEAAPAAEAAPQSDWVTYVTFGVCLLLGLAAGGYMIFGQKKKKKRVPIQSAPESEKLDFEFAGAPETPASKPLVSAAPPREKRSTSSTGTVKPPAAASSSSAAATAKPTLKSPAVRPKPKPRPEA